MALTKPAGCFLQLVSIPLLFMGVVLLLNAFAGTMDPVWAVITLGAGLVLLYVGGQPARRREDPLQFQVHINVTTNPPGRDE